MGAYAQISKNMADTGATIGKGVGELVGGYLAVRAQEDALNEQTKSPIFMEGLNKALTGIAAKKATVQKAIAALGVPKPELEDDPSNPQHPENLTPERAQQVALLTAYEEAEKTGTAFLKDPSKFDNKKKLQLIGMVTSVNTLFDAETKQKADAAAAALTTRGKEADIAAKLAAANTARTKAVADALAAVRPDTKEAKNIVAAVINSATTRTPQEAANRLEVLQREIALAKADAEKGIGYGPTQTQQIEFATLVQYIKDENSPTTKTDWAEGEDKAFMSPEAAQARIEQLDKEIEAAVKKGGDVAGLTQLRNDLQMELDVSEHTGFVYTGNFDSAEQLYNKGQNLARNYRSAVSHIQMLSELQNKTGGIFIPPISEQDKASIFRMVALGTNDVEDLSTATRYKIGDNGEILEVPLSKEDIERLALGQGLMSEEKKASEQLKALQLAAQTQQRQFGKVSVKTATILKDPNNPAAGTHTFKQYVPEQWDIAVFVPDHPELSVYVAGIMAGDGTATNANVTKLREELVESNKVLQAMAAAKKILVGPNGVPKAKLTDAEKQEFAAQIFEVKRGLGKGLGPLGPSDYALINSKIATPTPFGNINVNSPTFVRDLIQATFWDDYTKDPQRYVNDINRIMVSHVTQIKNVFRNGVGVTAVDDNYGRVDGHFAVRSGMFMDDDAKFTEVIMDERTNGAIYMRQAVDALKERPPVMGPKKNEMIAKGAKAAVDFEAAIYSESLKDPILALEYQSFVRVMAKRASIKDDDAAGLKRWLDEDYKPAWASLAKYLNAQGIPQDVLKGFQFHKRVNPEAQ